jgi:RNA polymerase sigma factor (sigma-70 family)
MGKRAFDETVLPHLDAAFNYARWLAGNDAAPRMSCRMPASGRCFFPSLRGDDARAWLFTIVRNTWYSRVSRCARVPAARPVERIENQVPDGALDPEERLLQQHTVTRVRTALEQLPTQFREAIVLREIEGLSYKEIGAITRVRIGTVMSRLARARERLLAVLKLAATEPLL